MESTEKTRHEKYRELGGAHDYTAFKNQGSDRQLSICSALLTSLNLTSSSSSDAQTVIYITDTDGIQRFSHFFNNVLKEKSNTQYKRSPSHYEQCKLPSFQAQPVSSSPPGEQQRTSHSRSCAATAGSVRPCERTAPGRASS